MEASLTPDPSGLRVWSELDCRALRHNLDYLRRMAPGTPRVIVVVKADAYGHGVRDVVPAIADDVDVFAVASLAEAEVVRSVESGKDILLLSPCLPGERQDAVEHGWIATISSLEEANAYSELGTTQKPARVHIKIDTGMGRIGIWHEESPDLVRAVCNNPHLSLHSISTHLPSPDDDEEFTHDQLELFDSLVRDLRGIDPEISVHVLNSAGVLGYGREGHHDFIRVGLALYGSAPIATYQSHLRPVLSWKARITLIRHLPAGRSISYGRTFTTSRPTTVATVAVGYADGYPRQASNRDAVVLVDGRRCAILGRVTMDQILVDVSGTRAGVGDEVVLLGSRGNECILAAEVAEWAGTIAWDIFTGIGGRTVRCVRRDS